MPPGLRTVPTKYEAPSIQIFTQDSPFIGALLGGACIVHTFRYFNPKFVLGDGLPWLAHILHDLIEPSILVQRPWACRTIYN